MRVLKVKDDMMECSSRSCLLFGGHAEHNAKTDLGSGPPTLLVRSARSGGNGPRADSLSGTALLVWGWPRTLAGDPFR